VCGVQTWTPTVKTSAVQLSVVAQHGGAAIVGVPTAGGVLEGFTVDQHMSMSNTGGDLGLTDTFTSGTIASLDNRLIVAGLDAKIEMVRYYGFDADLTNPVELTKTPSTLIASPAILVVDGQRIAPTASATGVALERFDGYDAVDSLQIATTDAPTALTASSFGYLSIVGWSTATECYAAKIAGFSRGVSVEHFAGPCVAPRVAGNDAATSAVMVFEGDHQIRIAHIEGYQFEKGSRLLRGNAQAPRVIFDGTRFWVSYIDQRGELVVGFLDHDELISTALFGVRPDPQSYDLAIVEGRPWVVATDAATGYSAHEMCVGTE
jgi:hypothetical protein